jgi:hypothetical protein
MEVKIMKVTAVDVAAKGAHWELVTVAHIVDSSLQATTQAPDFNSNDGTNEVINQVTKYFTINVTLKKSSA